MIVIASIISSLLLPMLGCVVIWNRYANLGDGIIHTLVLAGILHSITNLPIVAAMVLSSSFFVVLSTYLQTHFNDHNLVLNISTAFLVALGIIIADTMGVSIEVENLFFGEIFFVDIWDVLTLSILTVLVGILLYKNFNNIVLSALSEDVAISLGIKVFALRFTILLISALCVSVLVKILGGMMVSGLLILPVFFAKIISRTPEQMLFKSILFSLLTNLVGLIFAYQLDLPFSATVTLMQITILFLTFSGKKYILNL